MYKILTFIQASFNTVLEHLGNITISNSVHWKK